MKNISSEFQIIYQGVFRIFQLIVPRVESYCKPSTNIQSGWPGLPSLLQLPQLVDQFLKCVQSSSVIIAIVRLQTQELSAVWILLWLTAIITSNVGSHLFRNILYTFSLIDCCSFLALLWILLLLLRLARIKHTLEHWKVSGWRNIVISEEWKTPRHFSPVSLHRHQLWLQICQKPFTSFL